ncbi:MAG: hypothetical protein HY689_09040 [Chloroflexi bacterium]|nr:hypothetical protein [Chloroflexota bacterium]
MQRLREPVQTPELICRVLEEAGVTHVFGVPGGLTVGIFNALAAHQDRITTVLVRHEQVAAGMADAFGRLTGRPAVLMGQGPFVASFGAFGIMEAH